MKETWNRAERGASSRHARGAAWQVCAAYGAVYGGGAGGGDGGGIILVVGGKHVERIEALG